MPTTTTDKTFKVVKTKRKRGRPAKRTKTAKEPAKMAVQRHTAKIIEQTPKRKGDMNIMHKRVIALFLNGLDAPEIAKQTKYSTKTIQNIVKQAREMVATIDQRLYVETYVKVYNGILNTYQTTNQELVSQYVGLQQERDTQQHILTDTPVPSKPPIIKAIATIEVALVKLTDKINSNNKNFVDMIARMGVPHSDSPKDIGTHPDSSLETFYEEVVMVDEGAEESLRRQLAYFDSKEVKGE